MSCLPYTEWCSKWTFSTEFIWNHSVKILCSICVQMGNTKDLFIRICTCFACLETLQEGLGTEQAHWIHSGWEIRSTRGSQTCKPHQQWGQQAFPILPPFSPNMALEWTLKFPCEYFFQLKYKEVYEKLKGHYLAGKDIGDFPSVIHSREFQKMRSVVRNERVWNIFNLIYFTIYFPDEIHCFIT